MSSDTKPININDFKLAIEDLSDENLQSIKDQLATSVAKLQDTNKLLETELIATKEKVANLGRDESHGTLKDDLSLYNETIEENKTVILNQKERLTALYDKLKSRGLATQSPATEDKGIYL